MLGLPVLVLHQNYLPINVTHVKRAVMLILRRKAEVIQNGNGEIHTLNWSLPVPSVIRLFYCPPLPPRQVRLTKFEVFNRDRFTCQYCGRKTTQLTLDHVIPRHRGGEHSWENIVTACIPCNHRKAGKTPEEAGLRLIRKPKPPPPQFFPIPYRYLENYPQWSPFLPWL